MENNTDNDYSEQIQELKIALSLDMIDIINVGRAFNSYLGQFMEDNPNFPKSLIDAIYYEFSFTDEEKELIKWIMSV